MKPEAQRIAIAEACGWTWWHCESLKTITFRDSPITELTLNGKSVYDWKRIERPEKWQTIALRCPNYLSDLNAMHSAEATLDPIQPENTDEVSRSWDEYETTLHHICEDDDPKHSEIHATAAQRAEAFLRTINKWIE